MVELTAQEAITLLKTDEEKFRAFEAQRQQLIIALQEISLAKGNLDIIPNKQESALVPIGAGVFLPVTTKEAKVNVEVGMGVVLEESLGGASELLNKREELIKNNLTELEKEMEKISSRIRNLGDKIKTYMEQQRPDNVPVIG